MTPISALAMTEIVICLWAGGLFGFGIGRFFRLRATYKGRRQVKQSNVFPMDRRGFEIPRSWHDKNSKHDEIPF